MILLDTHVIYWFAFESPRIGAQAKAMIEREWRANHCAISSITLWELAMLISKNRIDFHEPLSKWHDDMLKLGLKEISVDGKIGILSCQLDLHGDPADRIIAATAIIQGATLVTADAKLLDWQHPLKRFDAQI